MSRSSHQTGNDPDQDRTVVILTDGEANLAHYMNLLREEGCRVLATTRPYEAALWLTRQDVSVFIARDGLLPDETGEYLRALRDIHPRPFTVVTHEVGRAGQQPNPLVDIWLAEPYTYAALLDALGFGGDSYSQRKKVIDAERAVMADAAAGLDELPATVSNDNGVSSDAPLPKIFQVVSACRALTELERDREQLLTQALEHFMEVTESERGSIMLTMEGSDTLQVVRRSGFPDDTTGPLQQPIGKEIAGKVVATDAPLMVDDVEADFPGRPSRGYRGTAFLAVPLTNRQTTLGVINLTDRRGGEAYTREDLMHGMMLADQLAVTLSNAQTLADLHAMTVVDPLTHLFNRRHFDRELKKELERARRYGRQLTLALLDIDNFKAFNDVYGYVTGDNVLRSVADVIRESFREVDVVTRWGGDEFAILLPETGRPPAGGDGASQRKGYIDRVRTAVEQTDFTDQVPGLNGRITLSAGVATFPVDCLTEGDLFRKANEALQEAKRSGTNRTCFARSDVPEAKGRDDSTTEAQAIEREAGS